MQKCQEGRMERNDGSKNKKNNIKWKPRIRDIRTAANLKKEGVKRGVPDICLPVSRGKYHGLYIEMKAGKNKPSKEQKEWIN